MKPIYVKMSAFGSYAGEELVDFSEVNHGIFLITGDTGAGKTTIFDAITYALYDQTSGGKRDGEMMRSQFAKEDVRTFVEFKFSYNNEVYKITRYPRQYRISKKKNKDGEYTMTVDSPSVELIMPDGLPFQGKIKETNQKIVEIIGLDVNQFTQIAMIAQGDFLKLLHAPSKERKEIFAKIFNTKIYSLIEEELRSRAKSMYGKLEDNRKDIVRELENVQLIEESSYANEWKEKTHFLESNPESILALLKHLIEEVKDMEDKINQEIKMNQEELDRVQASLQQARDLNRLFEALDKSLKTREELEKRADEMKEIKSRIELGKKASIIEPKEQMYLSKRREVEACRKRIKLIEEWLEHNVKVLDELKKRKDQSEADYIKKNPELTTKINKINELLPKYTQFEEVQSRRSQLENKKNKGKLDLEGLNLKMETFNKQQEDLNTEQESLKQISEQLLLHSQSVEKLTDRLNSLVSLWKAIKDLQTMKITVDHAEKEHQLSLKEYETQVQAYEELYHVFIEGQAGIIAGTLTEGSPCPVCGSTSHPHKATLTEANISQKELQAAKKRMEDADKEKQTKYDLLQKAKQSYESQKKLADHEGKKLLGEDFQAEGITENEVKVFIDETNTRLKMEQKNKLEAEAAKKRYDHNEAELKRLSDEMKNLLSLREASEQALKQLEIGIAQADTIIEGLKKELIYESKKAAEEELSASNEQIQILEASRQKAVNSYQELLQQTTERQGNKKTEESTLARLGEETEKAEDSFLKELKDQGFRNIEEYHLSYLDAGKLESLSNQYLSYREEVIKNEENLKTYKEQTKGKSKIQTEDMEKRKGELDRFKALLEGQAKEIYGIRTRNENIYQKIKKLLELRQEAVEEYRIISRLDNTANGKLSQCHLNFQTYIQRRYFKSILREANKRLYQMSNGQFILQCRDVKELSGQGEVGLDLDIYSMVNDQTRDVKTLSGGESFIAALAMALGMADIIQNSAGSVHIDTMFIDEGFGTLSEETRTQAIKILNGLSEGKRLVGIISHVSELKAQIGTKLVVSKTEKGSKVRWEIAE